VIPRLKVQARVVSVELGADLALLPPRSPSLVGWWTGSARPGAPRGGTVIAGHTVHTGGGALDALPTLRVGDQVDVRTRLGTMRYRVDEVVTYHKDQLAREAEQIFGQAVSARLVVVTCDEWDGSSYLSNVVAYATPVKAIPVAKQAA
jgi:LPXTG-site transpeptidase (sortase) family protein